VSLRQKRERGGAIEAKTADLRAAGINAVLGDGVDVVAVLGDALDCVEAFVSSTATKPGSPLSRG
jgi:hypothetical protein